VLNELLDSDADELKSELKVARDANIDLGNLVLNNLEKLNEKSNSKELMIESVEILENILHITPQNENLTQIKKVELSEKLSRIKMTDNFPTLEGRNQELQTRSKKVDKTKKMTKILDVSLT
jgi:hypothetical protein